MSDISNVNNKYIATVKVGRDTVEAEYFKSNFKFPSNYKFNFWTFFHRVRFKIKDVCWQIRYGFQRMFKGYDSVDTFETYAKFIERYTKILTDYRKHHVGYVCGMTNEEWEAIVDEMLYHLHYMDEETVTEELEKDISEEWIVSSNTVYEIMDSHKDEFFKLFSEYFYNLWD